MASKVGRQSSAATCDSLKKVGRSGRKENSGTNAELLAVRVGTDLSKAEKILRVLVGYGWK